MIIVGIAIERLECITTDPQNGARVDCGLKRFRSFACWLTFQHLILEANDINILKDLDSLLIW